VQRSKLNDELAVFANIKLCYDHDHGDSCSSVARPTQKIAAAGSYS